MLSPLSSRPVFCSSLCSSSSTSYGEGLAAYFDDGFGQSMSGMHSRAVRRKASWMVFWEVSPKVPHIGCPPQQLL